MSEERWAQTYAMMPKLLEYTRDSIRRVESLLQVVIPTTQSAEAGQGTPAVLLGAPSLASASSGGGVLADGGASGSGTTAATEDSSPCGPDTTVPMPSIAPLAPLVSEAAGKSSVWPFTVSEEAFPQDVFLPGTSSVPQAWSAPAAAAEEATVMLQRLGQRLSVPSPPPLPAVAVATGVQGAAGGVADAGQLFHGLGGPATDAWPPPPAPVVDSGRSEQEEYLEDFGDVDLSMFPSEGSARHASGTCKPCLFWYQGSCHKNQRCRFCHIPHETDDVKKIRPSKKTRNLLQQHRQR